MLGLVRTIEEEDRPSLPEFPEEDDDLNPIEFEAPKTYRKRSLLKEAMEQEEGEDDEDEDDEFDDDDDDEDDEDEDDDDFGDEDDEDSESDEEEDEEEEEEEDNDERKMSMSQDLGTKKDSKRKGKGLSKDGKDDEKSEKDGIFKDVVVYADSTQVQVPDSYADMQLSKPLVRALQKMKYSRPTPVQAACIPYALAGRDISGSAPTGSGKTAAYLVPLLERLQFRDRSQPWIRAIILAPTRELVAQIQEFAEKLSENLRVSISRAVGGESVKNQAAELRLRPDIVVATPGRLIDLVRNYPGIDVSSVEIFVMDEADRLLDMGFRGEVAELVRLLPSQRQSMLFSATMTEDVTALGKLSLRKPIRVRVDRNSRVAPGITQEFVKLTGSLSQKREAVLLSLLTKVYPNRVVVFAASKKDVRRLQLILSACQLKVAMLHGNLSQAQRAEQLALFERGETDILVASDLAARGLDIPKVRAIVNYQMPTTLSRYIHRVGRTARWGHLGVAVSLVATDDSPLLSQIVQSATADKAPILTRELASADVDRAQRLVESVNKSVASSLAEDAMEMHIRNAEMEATRAANMLEYEDQIMARPKRTWFQSEAQKKQTRQASRYEQLGIAVEGTSSETQPKNAGLRNERRNALKMGRASQSSRAGPDLAVKLAARAIKRSQKEKMFDVESEKLYQPGLAGAMERRAQGVGSRNRGRKGTAFKGAAKSKSRAVQHKSFFGGSVPGSSPAKSLGPNQKSSFKTKSRFRRRK